MALNLIRGNFQYINFSGWDGGEKDDEGESNCKGLWSEYLVKVKAGSTGLFHQVYRGKWKRLRLKRKLVWRRLWKFEHVYG